MMLLLIKAKHLIFEEMCFDRFLHFILSFSFVRSLWLWLFRGGTQSCGRPPLLRRIVALCMCISYVTPHIRPFLLLPPVFIVLYSRHTATFFYWYYAVWVISISLLNKCCARRMKLSRIIRRSSKFNNNNKHYSVGGACNRHWAAVSYVLSLGNMYYKTIFEIV